MLRKIRNLLPSRDSFSPEIEIPADLVARFEAVLLVASTAEPEFGRFKDLPKEVRIMIWEAALPDPRIVHIKLHHQPMSKFGLRRVRSDLPVLPIGETHRIQKPWWSVWRRERQEDDDRSYVPGVTDYRTRYEGVVNMAHRVNLDPGDLYGWKSDTPAPAMLFVCQESHFVASKAYVRAFGTATASPETWFDFKRDYLYLNADSFSCLTKYDCRPPDLYWDDLEDHLSCQELFNVRNAAFLMDGKGDFTPRQVAGLDDSSTYAYENWFLSLVERFRYLRHVVLVTEHYRGEHYEPGMNPRDEARLAFLRSEDINATIAKLAEEDTQADARLSRGRINLKPKALEKMLEDIYAGGNESPLALPPIVIEEKIVSTLATKRKIEALEQRYEESTSRLHFLPTLTSQILINHGDKENSIYFTFIDDFLKKTELGDVKLSPRAVVRGRVVVDM